MTCSVEGEDGFTRFAEAESQLPPEEEDFVVEGSFQEEVKFGR